MNYFYITGTSRGIGKALAEKLLKNENNRVIGISRNISIEHKNYQHIKLDLSDMEKVQQFRFNNHSDAKKIALINNSGMLGDIKQLGRMNNEQIITTYNVNISSPTVLINKFLNKYNTFKGEMIILNISSGAAKYPVASWSTYCSTKAALDMIAKVADAEKNEKNTQNLKIYSIAPGIVDTKMQDEIREIPESDFSNVNSFIDFKENNDLVNINDVANQLIDIMENTNKYNDVIMDLRNV